MVVCALAVAQSRGLSSVPAAAARRLEIIRLEHEMEEERENKARVRELRKRLNALRRATPQPSEVRVATFYRFLELDPETCRVRLSAALEALGVVLGSVTVSREGVNGALAVPAGIEFELETVLAESLGFDVELNWAPATRASPFLHLRVRSKPKILEDGLAEELDWSVCGSELEPAAWHEALSSGEAVVLDVRNGYESALGSFENATLLNTDSFARSWHRLDDLLRDKPSDTKILMFCTGGIRCVKGGAYVRQKLGFTNVHRLKHGVVGYERWLAEEEGVRASSSSSSLFRGSNFVFDRRKEAD
ncbi:hypothetical protein CTAYLR_001111 [Chrysophaeum taylorii]|uniref:Rhodanese domain-containing protein n=1 Tax=Chrysophaeum taylorii TaxID=2483200 RepID=A0AAD7URF6_9STRA|nr:hypothetical protein CTAYLR_001111 [Chrysophaeum taylorii]